MKLKYPKVDYITYLILSQVSIQRCLVQLIPFSHRHRLTGIAKEEEIKEKPKTDVDQVHHLHLQL